MRCQHWQYKNKRGCSRLVIQTTTLQLISAFKVTMTSGSSRGIVIFSGGSAANNLVNVFSQVAEGRGTLSYVIPISDNGGST
jgi:hypothetical protein